MAKTFHCTVITPERPVLERDATFVAFPAFDGEMGVLPHRAPILAKLGAGELRVESREGNAAFFINGGFAQMVDDKLTLLTEEAKPKAELDRGKAAQELASALALPALDEPQAQARERAVTRARALVRVAS